MRVVIFIGHHKVGSTSLQDYFARNAALFASHGVLYPFTDFQGAASLMDDLVNLARPVSRKKIASMSSLNFLNNHVPINIREPHNALAFSMLSDEHEPWIIPEIHSNLPSTEQMLHAMKQQVDFMRPHTVVLISEVMANFGKGLHAGITRIKELFEPAEFTIYASIRRIDQYIASWHGQRLWFGDKLRPLRRNGLEHHFGTIHFDYRLMIDKWVENVPGSKFILRDYADVLENGGSIKDFVEACNLKLPARTRSARRVNSSYHRALYEVVRKANKKLPAQKAENFRNKIEQRQASLKLPPSDDIELFGKAVRKRLFQNFKPVNQSLGQHVDRRVFFKARRAMLSTCKIPELEATKIAVEQLQNNIDWFGDPKIRNFISEL